MPRTAPASLGRFDARQDKWRSSGMKRLAWWRGAGHIIHPAELPDQLCLLLELRRHGRPHRPGEDRAAVAGAHSQDKLNMYNESSRPALFTALNERSEFHGYKPIFRAFYSKPARIFLVRAHGEFTIPV